MIGKKVRNPGHSTTLRVRVQRLADYIDCPERGVPMDRAGDAHDAHDARSGRVERLADDAQRPEAGPTREKCIHAGARGFLATDRAARKVEMLGLAQVSAHSKDPIGHYVLSWQQGEQPTPAQVEEAVDLLLDEMELTGHQVFYGLHVDTDNVHLHVMVNRVHPTSRQVVQSNRGFDLEAVHRAVARIEHAQGWRREARGRYRMHADGALRREPYPEPQDGRPHRSGPHPPVRAGGAKSAERIAAEASAPWIRSAARWADAAQAPEPAESSEASDGVEPRAARNRYDAGKRNAARAVRERQQEERTRLNAAQRAQRSALVASEAGPAAPHAHDLRGFVAIVYDRRVDYRRAESASGWPSFVDRGREIVVRADRDPDAVRAALHLATQKWGRFRVEGDAAYQALCVRLAAEHGFPLGHPEPQAALQQARGPTARPSA
jgi:hypothetical protein